jgi:hypothetical protein
LTFDKDPRNRIGAGGASLAADVFLFSVVQIQNGGFIQDSVENFYIFLIHPSFSPNILKNDYLSTFCYLFT